MPMMPTIEHRRFRVWLAAIVIGYALLETAYVLRLPVVMDEFDGAYEAYRLRSELPYRNFVPYKTVIGYYIEAIPAALHVDVWTRIIAIKLWLVAINAAVLAASALYLGRIFDRRGVLAALLMLVMCSNFLERSAELRVDMLTAWAGLASLLLLLRSRFVAAGAFCALSFLISQKAAFYFIAADVALAVTWLAVERTRARFRGMVMFNVAFASGILLYIAAWSAVAPARRIVTATFLAAAGPALNAAYDIRARFWSQILLRNPVYFLLSGIAIVMLLRRRQVSDIFVAVYSFVMLALCAVYSQPWPYFFPMLLVVVYVLHAAWFSAVELKQWQWVAIVAGAVLLPAVRIPIALARDQSYQRYNVRLASALLGPHETYVAGTDIIHDHEQSLETLERLDGVMLARLRALPPAALNRTVAALDAQPPKLIVSNYRVAGMPRAILDYVDANYGRLAGSILSYAPQFASGARSVLLKFAGRYRVDTPAPGTVDIDGIARHTGDLFDLPAGPHRIAATQPVRLRLLPAGIEAVLDARFAEEQAFYPDVYDY
jgi:hypothetical protein